MAASDLALQRQRHPLAGLAARHVAFLDVLRAWEAGRVGGRLPTASHIAAPGDEAGIEHVHALSVEWRGPVRASFELAWSRGVPLPPETRVPSAGGALQRARRQDLTAIVFIGTPAYHRIVAACEGRIWRYERLILPVARDGRRVDLVIVCADRIESTFRH